LEKAASDAESIVTEDASSLSAEITAAEGAWISIPISSEVFDTYAKEELQTPIVKIS
jgi:hypothetical protein